MMIASSIIFLRLFPFRDRVSSTYSRYAKPVQVQCWWTLREDTSFLFEMFSRRAFMVEDSALEWEKFYDCCVLSFWIWLLSTVVLVGLMLQ